MNKYTSPWTEQETETLKKMWLAGKSAREISTELKGKHQDQQ